MTISVIFEIITNNYYQISLKNLSFFFGTNTLFLEMPLILDFVSFDGKTCNFHYASAIN